MSSIKMWTSDRRLYLDAAGSVVEHDNPTKVSLLVGAGCQMPYVEAEKLGLILPIEPPSVVKAEDGEGAEAADPLASLTKAELQAMLKDAGVAFARGANRDALLALAAAIPVEVDGADDAEAEGEDESDTADGAEGAEAEGAEAPADDEQAS